MKPVNVHKLFSDRLTYYSYQDYFDLAVKQTNQIGLLDQAELTEQQKAIKINTQRMKRIYAKAVFNKDFVEFTKKIKSKWTWYLLLETWCGDGAQTAPIIARIAELSKNIDLKILLRDDNIEVIDAYLTNGGRAIPKLICVDTQSMDELGTWGARPSKIQKAVVDFKLKNPDIPKEEFILKVQSFYNEDKGQAIQDDFLTLMKDWEDIYVNGYNNIFKNKVV